LTNFRTPANFNILEVFSPCRATTREKNCLYVVTSSYQEQVCTILLKSYLYYSVILKLLLLIHLIFNGPASNLIDRHLTGIKLGLQLKISWWILPPAILCISISLCQEMICLCGVYGQEEIYAPILTPGRGKFGV